MAGTRMVWVTKEAKDYIGHATVTDTAIPLARQSYATILEYPTECTMVITTKYSTTVRSTRKGLAAAQRIAEDLLIKFG